MLVFLRDYWGLISGGLIFVVWVGRLTQMVYELRRRPEGVTVVSCRRQQTDCIALIDTKLASGEHEFAALGGDLKELRNQIVHEAQINETRHNMIINHLLELKK